MIEVSIYFKIEYKDMIVNTLLNDGYDDFYFFECNKYSSKLLKSAKEKVTGRIDFGKFELILKDEDKDGIINKLYVMIGKKELNIFIRNLEEK